MGYIGFWIVAFTGELPRGLQDLITMWLRWGARAYGWLAGITDEYPPFDPDPQGFPIDARTPVNESPSKGWAVAGIFVFPKAICAIPHLFLLWFVMVAVVVVTWVGYVVTFFTGRFPDRDAGLHRRGHAVVHPGAVVAPGIDRRVPTLRRGDLTGRLRAPSPAAAGEGGG